MIVCIARMILLLACCIGVAHAADSYPSHPIRFVVGFAPGGGADGSARIYAPKLTELMGQNWLVDNRTGAGGNLATELVARASPDGYTALLILDTQLTANPSLYTLTFDPQKDIQPVIILTVTDQILVVHPGVAAKTFPEFVTLAKQKPGEFRYGSGGVGSSNHLAGELVKKVVGIDIVHVPYKGAAPSIAAILGGEIQMNISSPASTVGFITSGKLRALARTSLKRRKVLPDLVTVAESGYPGFEVLQWYGIGVPRATPKPVVDAIRSAVIKAAGTPEVQGLMDKLGFEPEITSQADMAARIRKESATWAAVIKEQGIKLQ